MFLVTANEMQKMDRRTIEVFGIPGRVLMENAGRGATAFFLETLYRNNHGAVGVMAGRGNNGGDGFVMARYLHQKGIAVTVFLLSDKTRVAGDAAANLQLLETMGVPIVEILDEETFDKAHASLAHQQFWIDAILGTGLNSAVRGLFRKAIDFINQLGRPVFAVDIPSGLNADTGQVCGTAIQATATATFGFAKVGHLTFPGRTLTGRLRVVEIGIPPHVAMEVGCGQHLITSRLVQRVLPRRTDSAHKGTTGHLLVLAGSPGKTGAAAMTATAAMRIGAGLVTLGVPRSLNPVLETLVTEAMTVPLDESDQGTLDESALDTISSLMAGKRCLAIGPGIGTSPSTGRLLAKLIESADIPLVIDADGLNLIAADPGILSTCKAPVVLTPHPGEMARLSGQSTAAIQENRIDQARLFAKTHGAIVILKGAGTVIAQPDGTVFVNPTGNPGMAAGGMGDVLTGIVAGLIAQGMTAEQAALSGVYVHGLAADSLSQSKAPVGYLATEVMQALPEAVRTILTGENSIAFLGLDPLFYQQSA